MTRLDEDIKKYLPQYLSDAEMGRLKKELEQFPTDGTKDTIYTNALADADYLLQGDCIGDMDYLAFPDMRRGKVNAILLSNTCDMSTTNKRMNACRIMYAPVLNFCKYAEQLRKDFSEERVSNHLKDIKAQQISQILYLPKGGKLPYEGIVFFDRVISVPLNEERVKGMCGKKMFTLSNFGFYLFLFKISVHFTRIQERIDRSTGEDLGKTQNTQKPRDLSLDVAKERLEWAIG